MPKYTVIINGEERTIDKDKFDGNIEAISAKYPDAKIKAINGDEEGMLPVSNYSKAIEKGYRMVESKTDIPVSRFVQGKGKDTTIFGVPYSIYAQMKPESQSYYYQKALNEEREQERKQMAEQASSIKGKADEQHVSAMGDKVQADYDAVMNNPFLTINDPMMGVEMKTPEQTKSQKKVELTRAASERADDAFNMIEEAGKKGNTSFVSGFGRGFWEKVSKASTWDFGGRDMQANLAIASAAKKYESGQPLSNEEENLLDAVALEAAANGEFSGDLGRGYKAGMTTAESLPFMAEFMINPATGTGEAISKAAAKKIISNFGKEAAKSTIGKIARNSVRVAGDIAGAGIMSGTTGAMRTSADAVDRMIGDVSPIIDSDGYYRFGGTEGGEGLAKSLVKAYGASTIENFSEMFGNYLAPIGGVLGTSARKGMSKIGLGKVNKVIGDIKSSDIARVLDDFQSKTQWNGTIGEYLEEQAGMAMNALTVGDNNLSDIVDVDTQIDTFLGVSSLGGLFSGIKTFGYAKNKYSAKQKLNEADRSAANNSEIDELDWNDLKERINQADDSELVSILSETFRNDDIRDDSKQTILLYAGRLKAYHGASLADLKRKTEGDTPDEIVQSQMNFDEGYKLAEADRSEKRSALRNMNELERKLDDEFIYASDEDRYNLVRQRADAGEEVSNELAYINSQSKLNGMILGIRDAIDEKVAKSNQYIANLTHQDGNVYDVTLTVDEKKHVFPISGKIVFDENGIVDRKQSDSRFIVRDDTGKVEMRSVEDLYKLESSNNADVLKDITAQSIREQESARYAEEIETPSEEEIADEVASIQPGDVISLDMQGMQMSATVQSRRNGSTVLQFDDPIEYEGKKVQAIELPDEQMQAMIIPSEEKGNNMIDPIGENEGSQQTEENKLIDMPMGAEGIINQEEESAEEMESKSPLQDVSASDISIPIDDKGNLLYHKAPVEMTIADLNDGNLTADEVDAFVSANRDETTKLLKKVSEKAPKIGTNKARYLEEKKRWADTVADINSQVAYWNEVEAQLQATREQPGDTTANEIKAMGEPLNGAELAAMMLGAGRLPLLYNDYKRETGFSNSDARGMFGMFSTKDNGGMTVEQAGEQLMLADMEAGTNFFDQNDPNAGRNAILDVLSSARTRGGLINYIKNNREAMAERERQAEAEADELAKEQWFQDNYHMTFEEYQLWEQGELFTESNMISDEEYQKFMSIFADRILNEQENDRRTSQESGSSIAESESNEQGGISGVRESSSTVLQGEESVSAGTTGRVEEESGQIDANGSVEYDALQSGTSRGELVSSSRNQENVPESILPRIEGEYLLDYAGRVNDAHVLHEEEQKVNLNPTDAQKETGNYKKGHIKVDGFDITIENPKGSERSGVDANGKSWSITMNNTYGYIRGTEGVDGDHIDLFLGNSGNGVYVVDQVNEDGSFDEHKVMYGFGSIDEAKEAYLSNYSPGWKGLGNITSVSKETFKKWIESSRRKTKPFSEYKISQNKKTWQMTAKEYAYSVGSPKMEIEIDSGVSFHQLSKMSEKAKESRAKQRIEKRNIANNKYRLAVEEWENKIWDAYLNGEFSANDVYDTEAFYVLSERINDLGVDMDSPFKISKRNPQERETYLKGIDSILSEKKQADSEEQSIIERAKDNGTYMKAPNGKPTRLDERQWVQVRTTAFKRWFGDWEQSPENASKVLDENGEPLVVYHGTSGGGFTIFNTYGSNFGLFGQGSYFTDNREVAESYTEKGKGDKRQVYGVFLNIRRPLDMNSHDIAKGWKEVLPDDINLEIGEDSTNESVYKSVLESFEYNEYPKSEAQEILYDLPVALGYDGVTHIGGGRYNKTSDTRHQVWIAMEPTQIKSATDNKGEFSGDNGDIRFREVYHGSPYDFDQFDHSFINTGEGSQTFGWGTYVTEVNGIAKGYAEKLASRSQTKRINELARSIATKKDFIKARKQDIKRNEDYDKYARAIKKNLKGLYAELKNAKKEENEKDTQFYQSLVEVVEQQLDRDYYNNLLDSFWSDINNTQKEIDEMEKDIADLNRQIKKLKGKRHLYTVEIPDSDGINYLNWNEPLTVIQKNMIADQAEKDGYGDYQISYRDENGNLTLNTSSDVTGEALYKELSKEFLLGSDKATSEFLNRAGFVGIEYPAEAMSGGREDNAKNYVIFNEKDLAVEEHVRFRDKENGTIKTYHGSGAEFDKFDLSHSGEGKGESMLGKGVYTTKDKHIARNYADVASNREIGGRKHLYEVEIPTDNGKNYLDYDKVYDAEEMSEIAGRLRNVGVNVDFGRYFNGGRANGKNLYMVMDWSMPDGMNVNQVLSDAGYVGYKYSTRHDLGGKEKLFPKKSYVVFDEGNTTISSHEQIESEIEKLSDVLHVPVKMVRSLDELPDGMARRAIENGRNVKGWFDTKIGEVVVYLPNVTGEEDAKATFLHEIVGHKGLRALLGEKSYDDEMVRLYGLLPAEERKIVTSAAVHDYGGNVAIAMDEYLAEQAEKDKTPSWWNKVVSAIRDLLRKKGINVTLSKGDVKYLLWRSRKKLESGNPFDVAKDITMRYRLSLGEFNDSSFQQKYEQMKDEMERLNLLNSHNVYLANDKDELCFQMSTDGASARSIDYIRSIFDKAEEEQKNFFGFFDYETGKIYLCANQIKHIEQLRAKWGHEICHQITSKIPDSSLADLYDIIGADEVDGLIGDAYYSLSKERKVDEYISTIVEEIISDQESFDEIMNGENIDAVLENWELPYAVVPYIANSFKSIFYGKKEDKEVLGIERGGKERENELRLSGDVRTQGEEGAEGRGSQEDEIRFRLGETNKGEDRLRKKIEEESTGSGVEDSSIDRDGDPEIHERVLARDRYERRVRSGMYQTQEALQDSMLGLKEAMDAILKAEGTDKYIEDISGFENAYLGENSLSSVNKAEADAFAHTIFKPMLEEVVKFAKNETERWNLTDYMMAKHGLERNANMAERDAQEEIKAGSTESYDDILAKYRQKDYAGLTALTGIEDVADAEEEARRMVDDYERDNDTEELWKKVNSVSNAILEKLYQSGMMSKATYKKVKEMYEFYIPLRGFDEKTSDEAYAYLSSKQSAFNAPIKIAKGRKSKADDPFANLQSMAESAIMQGNRNKLVKQRFLNFALNHPSDLVSVSDLWLEYDKTSDEWKPVFPDNIGDTDTPGEVEKKMKDFEEKMEILSEKYPDQYKHGKDAVNIPYRVVEIRDLRQHQIVVKCSARDYVVTINGNPRAAQALNGQTNPDNDLSGAIGVILKAGEMVNRQLSAFYTTRNPDFIVSNFIRDMIYSNTMAWVKENPNYALRYNRNFAMTNPAKMKILVSKYRKGEINMNDTTERMFHQFMMNGGETGYTNVRDVEQHKNDIRRELKRSNGKLKISRAISLLGERLDEYNRAVENCARFSAFVTSREMGRSIDRAIYDAKEISVNFNKKGSGAKFMGGTGQTTAGNASAFISGVGRSAYVFWNAAIQGTTNYGRQFKRHPAKAFVGAAAMFTLGAIMAGIGGDDDEDDKNAYYNLPEHVRRSNILFRMGDQWISIPLSIEYRGFYGMGELMMSTLKGKEHLTGAEIAEAIAGQVSQVLPIDFMEGGGNLTAFIPSAAKPIYEAYVREKGWTGMPLYKDTPYNKDMPEWTKAYKSANKYIVNLCAILNEAKMPWQTELERGDKYTKGAIDLNPSKIEYMLNGYFGGVSGTIDKLTKTAETIVGQREYDPRSFLLLNRLVKNGDENTEYRAVNNEYYRLRDEHENLKSRVKHYEEDTYNDIFDYAKKIDFLYNSPEYERYEIFEKYKSSIDAIYEELKEFVDEDERKQAESRLNEIKKEMIDEINFARKHK